MNCDPIERSLVHCESEREREREKEKGAKTRELGKASSTNESRVDRIKEPEVDE